jgi:hypothetical protein
MNKSCVYIAGQTAPGSGIVFRSSTEGMFSWSVGGSTHDVVIRYVRFEGFRYNLIVRGGGPHILDHVTTRWSGDELLILAMFRNSSGTLLGLPRRNVTVSRILLYESLGTFGDQEPVGMIITASRRHFPTGESENNDIHHSLFASINHRMPMFSNIVNGKAVNNVIYDWGQYASGNGGINGYAKADYINNFYKEGPNTSVINMTRHPISVSCMAEEITGWSGTYPMPVGAEGFGATNGVSNLYVSGNISSQNTSGRGDGWSGSTRQVACVRTSGPANVEGEDPWKNGNPVQVRSTIDGRVYNAVWKRDNPAPGPTHAFPISAQPAADAYSSIVTNGDVGANARLDCEGNWVWNSDASDARILNHVRNGTRQLPVGGGVNQLAGGHIAVYGGSPAPIAGTPCRDMNGDGVPDAYITKYGLSSDVDYSSVSLSGDGYTVLEAYLSGRSPQGIQAAIAPAARVASASASEPPTSAGNEAARVAGTMPRCTASLGRELLASVVRPNCSRDRSFYRSLPIVPMYSEDITRIRPCRGLRACSGLEWVSGARRNLPG